MPSTEELGIALAEDVLKAVEELGDEAIVNEINKIVEASSSGLQEAYMAAIRAQRASARAREHLEARLEKARASKAKPTAEAAPATTHPQG